MTGLEQPLLRLMQWLSKQLGVGMIFTYVGFFRMVIGLTFFSYIGYHDLKNRRIPKYIDTPLSIPLPEKVISSPLGKVLHTEENRWEVRIPTWHLAAGAALILLVWEMTHSVPSILWPRIAANVAIATIIGAGFYYIPRYAPISPRWKIFHMGDLKAVLLLGILIPTYPFAGPFPIFRSDPYLLRLFFLAILQWTAIIGIFYVISLTGLMLFRSRDEFKLPESILGYQVPTREFPSRDNTRVLHEHGKISFDGLSSEMAEDYLEWRNDPDTGVSPIDSFEDIDKVYLEQFFKQTDYIDTEGLEKKKKENPEAYRRDIEHDEEHFKEIAQKDQVWLLPDIPLVTLIAVGLWCAAILGDPLYIILLYWPF